MPIEKRADTEPIRGYRLIERLGAGGFGEVWKCEAPGGIFKAVKFVYGSVNGLGENSGHAEEELRAFQLIKSIRHPFLLSIDRVEIVSGELIIITELADQNLQELTEHYRQQNLAGMPREELLGYLQESAEVLDLLNKKFDLQHLDIKPANLFLVCNHVKVADFGLVNQMTGVNADKISTALNAVTPLYAAPELFLGKISRHCDQYSLAIAYQEMLTGTLPFDGKNVRQLLMQHTQEAPNLQPLPIGDRAIVGRALAKNPDHRFGSCMELIRALKGEPAAVAMGRFSIAELQVPGGDSNMGDTAVVSRMSDTGPLPTKASKPSLPDNVLAGAKFPECLSNSPLMDVWKAIRPDGTKKRVAIMYGLGSMPNAKLKEALVRLQSIDHPALFMPEVIHIEPGRLVLQTDPQRETLRSRAQQCQARKQPGIPRGELVDYIRAAAEVLDYLYLQHNVQHLNLNSRNLILDNGWLQIAEFGYAQLLWAPAGQDIVQRNLRYIAPELLTNSPTRHCDQYSLALIFAELLTGVHPFRGLGPQSYLKNQTAPELGKLPDVDREVIRRALSLDPAKRFANCTEMVLALEGTSPELHQQLSERPDHFTQLVATERNAKKKTHVNSDGEIDVDYKAVILELIQRAGGIEEQGATEPVMNQSNDAIAFQFVAGIPLGAAHEQLREFCTQTSGQIAGQTDNRMAIRFELPTNRWQQWWGTKPTMELSVEMTRVNPMSATPIEIKAELKVLNCSKKKSLELFRTTGPELFSALQERMLINSEKRTKDRLLWPHPVTIVPIDRNGQPEEAIECRGKDLSHTGIGIYLPHDLDTAEVLVELPCHSTGKPVRIPAKLVRVKPTSEGWYEVGALFHLPVHKPALASANV